SLTGTLARIADAKHIVFSIATTWTLVKKNRYHLLFKSGFSPVSFWRFIAISVVGARNRVVMDASFVPPEKIRNERQMKSQHHSRKSRSYYGRQPPIG